MTTQAQDLRAFLTSAPTHRDVEVSGNTVRLIAPRECDLIDIWTKAEQGEWSAAKVANHLVALVAHSTDGEKLFDASNPANLAPLHHAPAGSPLVKLRGEVNRYITDINNPKFGTADGDEGNSHDTPDGGGGIGSPSEPGAASER